MSGLWCNLDVRPHALPFDSVRVNWRWIISGDHLDRCLALEVEWNRLRLEGRLRVAGIMPQDHDMVMTWMRSMMEMAAARFESMDPMALLALEAEGGPGERHVRRVARHLRSHEAMACSNASEILDARRRG